MSDRILVEVAYATAESQQIIALNVALGTTVAEAITLSGMVNVFPEIDLRVNKLGIFGKRVNAEKVLKPLDRVEIYRPLIGDAKEARKARVAASRAALKTALIAKNNQKL